MRFRRCCGCRHIPFWRNVILLFVLTFFVVMPFVSIRLHHTVFDRFIKRNETVQKHLLIQENSQRFNRSMEILRKFSSNIDAKTLQAQLKVLHKFPPNDGVKNSNAHGLFSADGSFANFGKNDIYDQMTTPPSEGRTGVAISIITLSRDWHVIENYVPNYLTQTVAAFLNLLNNTDSAFREYHVTLSVCNVDPVPRQHTEINNLPDWIPVINRFTKPGKHQLSLTFDELMEKEKQDYVFCLDRALEQNTSHVLLVEDDALPLKDLFPVLDHLILSKARGARSDASFVERIPSASVTYYKLYHPDRLLGYVSLEYERLPELFSLGLTVSALIVCVYTHCSSKKGIACLRLWVTAFVYTTLLVLTIGRANILELRRISKHFFQVTPAPGCCTPANLFPRNGGKLISKYLKTVECRDHFAKDTAIDELKVKKGLVTRHIQPNLFKHIGHFSSLRSKLINPFIV